jgi:hypothetical protein
VDVIVNLSVPEPVSIFSIPSTSRILPADIVAVPIAYRISK